MKYPEFEYILQMETDKLEMIGNEITNVPYFFKPKDQEIRDFIVSELNNRGIAL